MTADKRSITTDALATLGTIIGEAEKRDAIHLAVEPVIAEYRMLPGQHTAVVDGRAMSLSGKPVGIVDPFLTAPVEPGERFWLIVYPRQITSLRHVWEHPDFPSEAAVAGPNKVVSEQWLRDFCESNDVPDYEITLAAAIGHDGNSECIIIRGRDAHADIPSEFWTHVEIVTGRKIPAQRRAEFFSCSC